MPSELIKKIFEKTASNVVIFEPEETAIQEMLNNYQLSLETLFHVLTKTGGIVIDNWVRVYGCGEIDFVKRNRDFSSAGQILVAEDVAGGLFAVDYDGCVLYFAPDSLEWENLDVSYDRFIYWLTKSENIEQFYNTFRWDGWKEFIATLTLSQGICYYPPLWAKSDKARSVKAVSFAEVVALNFEFAQKLSEE